MHIKVRHAPSDKFDVAYSWGYAFTPPSEGYSKFVMLDSILLLESGCYGQSACVTGGASDDG